MNKKLEVGDRVTILDLDGFLQSESQGLFIGNTATIVGFKSRLAFLKTDGAESEEKSLSSEMTGWPFNPSAIEKSISTETTKET